MICETCYAMLRGHVGGQWRGTYDLHFRHHNDRSSLENSNIMNCGICRCIYAELCAYEGKDQYKVTKTASHGKQLMSAFLSAISGPEWDRDRGQNAFRLDFKFKELAKVGTFVLKESTESYSTRHTPFAKTTSSDEVLELAKRWIKNCDTNHRGNCSGDNTRYPTRLIDLYPSGLRCRMKNGAGQQSREHKSNGVSLVLKENIPMSKGYYYVTLSHCWGEGKMIKLESHNLEDFQRGIKLDLLPATFKDAIDFARRLGGKVKYIWIDSLCIIQGNTKAARDDWLSESLQMYEIYRNSYCNLSATAAIDGRQGMYRKRKPSQLWENETMLSSKGIPGLASSNSVHRCTIMDLNFWEKNVDEAPVNRRGWVLQERLLAPRVIHFCEKEIAWECHQMDAAESWPDGLPDFQLRAGGVIRGGRLKHLTSTGFEQGDETQEKIDLNGKDRDNSRLVKKYEPWKRVVEKYSRTKLTNAADKLIALSGIARMMAINFGKDNQYIAGLWRRGLESQLLWRVDPIYENGQFYYRSSRPHDSLGNAVKEYIAPSFSWAAVEAENGIIYANSTEGELHISIESVDINCGDSNNEFGLLNEGTSIMVSGIMKKIELTRPREYDQDQYRWKLAIESGSKEFGNVCLDAPEDDEKSFKILGPEGRMYCLPTRTDLGGYLICLLLQAVEEGSKSFRRIGLTRIPSYISGREVVLSHSDSGSNELATCDWDAESGRHSIFLI
ncbi:hypothetical protein HYFRA_00007522 [Hymenoscyphus fraxineus]|uniref:Heterokaryon incompatibility domain-containing protein n=1 Tax=Hymenoscyphus fraxineus TaxID=746836 RepID=A0A9N9KRI6_9HELO|nr:hypothetical protein HYFRA_00007522 [Hymenoscyphus fraxineus]